MNHRAITPGIHRSANHGKELSRPFRASGSNITAPLSISQLGSFELQLFLSIVALRGNAWGSKLQEYLSRERGKDVSIGQLYLSLSKLERKGFIESSNTVPEKVRGGRSKKVFSPSGAGARALEEFTAALRGPGTRLVEESTHGQTPQVVQGT
jgi:DNA-binding PadR family transcriptional regulator